MCISYTTFHVHAVMHIILMGKMGNIDNGISSSAPVCPSISSMGAETRRLMTSKSVATIAIEI
jgi:hypothetical protein